MKWTRKRGEWKPQIRMGLESSPDNSGYLAWSTGTLQVAALADGDVLEHQDDNWKLNGVALGARIPVPVSVEELEIEFWLDQNHSAIFRLVPAASWDWVGHTGAARIDLFLHDSGTLSNGISVLAFTKSSDGWHAKAAFPLTTRLPATASFSARGSGNDFPVRWNWKVFCLGLFGWDTLRRRQVDVPEGFQYPRLPAGIALDSFIPGDVVTDSEWHLVEGKGFSENETRCLCHLVKADGTDVTVGELIQARPARIECRGNAFSAHLALPAIRWPGRYFAVLTESRVSPNPGNGTGAGAYGPEVPFYPGAGYPERRAMRAFRLADHGHSNTVTEKRIARGFLPAPFSNDHALHFFSASDDANPSRPINGIFKAACSVPDGIWEPTSRLSGQGTKIVSWRGLVDSGKLLMLQIKDAQCSSERYLFLLDHGFDLDRDNWLAAPFAGIAMLKSAAWFGLSDVGDTSPKLELGSKAVTAYCPFFRINPDNSSIEISPGVAIRKRTLLCLVPLLSGR